MYRNDTNKPLQCRRYPGAAKHRWRRAALLALALGPLCPVARAEGAAQLLARGDYAGAAASFEADARQGKAVAQNNLGVLLLRGQGVSKDPVAARGWFEKAAAQGLRGAMYNLGMIFLRGYGTEVDRVAAAGWLEQAAKLGDPEAQFYLGMLHYRGTGGGGNPAVAGHWFELAAAQGVKEARFNLALLLLEGKGLQPDEARAVVLLEQLGESHPDAELVLARIHLQHGDDAQHAAAALRLFRKLAENGRPEAQAALGMMFVTGTGLKADPEEGRFWVAEAARQGFAPAQRQLGDLHAAGVGGERDLVEAQAWYALGAAQGDEEAGQRAAAVMQELTPENREKARARLKTLSVETPTTTAAPAP